MAGRQAQLDVMIIDNDKTVRESLITFFNQDNLSFLIFPTATEGLNAIKFQNVDVAIADYFLPDINGVSFLEQASRYHPGIMTILMSTIVTQELKIQANRAGIDALIEKPISATCIEQLLNQRIHLPFLEKKQ
jgi:two-component system response regulator YcbB